MRVIAFLLIFASATGQCQQPGYSKQELAKMAKSYKTVFDCRKSSSFSECVAPDKSINTLMNVSLLSAEYRGFLLGKLSVVSEFRDCRNKYGDDGLIYRTALIFNKEKSVTELIKKICK